jgi:hypothetical protein
MITVSSTMCTSFQYFLVSLMLDRRAQLAVAVVFALLASVVLGADGTEAAPVIARRP